MAVPDIDLTDADQTIYTCPATKRAKVEFVSFRNRSASTKFIDLYIVRSGQSEGVTNKIFEQLDIPQEDTYIFEHSLHLNDGDYLVAKAEANSSVNTIISVFEF